MTSPFKVKVLVLHIFEWLLTMLVHLGMSMVLLVDLDLLPQQIYITQHLKFSQ